jgi:serine/threonine protein kinase
MLVTNKLMIDKLNNYKFGDKIGHGAYGYVYKANNLVTGKMVAIKKTSKEDYRVSVNEINILKELSKEKHIVKLIDFIDLNQQIYIIFEHVDYNLQQFIKIPSFYKLLTPNVIRRFMYQLLSAVNECHYHGVIHRDIKPANILIDKFFNLKLCDFGLSRKSKDALCTFKYYIVTLWYRAPEILTHSRTYTNSIDIWACGCVLAEMITGKPIFSGNSNDEQLNRIQYALGIPHGDNMLKDFVPYANDNEYDLLKKLLKYYPDKRINAKKALEHPYFSE